MNVAAICQVAKGDKAIQAMGPAGAKARKYRTAVSPGAASLVGKEGTCESTRVGWRVGK